MAASAGKDFLLPKTSQGEVDWNALGNIVVEHLLAEVDSLCVPQVSSTEYKAEQVADVGSGWMFDYEKDGIAVFKKKTKNPKLMCFAGRGVVTAPYTDVAEFIKNPESAFFWDKFLIDSSYLKTLAQTPTFSDFIGKQVFSAFHCFSIIQREILCFIRCQYRDGKYIQSGISVQDKDYPPKKMRPRCEVHLGTGCVVEPYRGSSTTCLATYFGHIDTKGVPLFITNQVIQCHQMAVRSIQRNFSHRPSSPQLSPSPPHLSPSHHPPPSPTHSTSPYEEDLSINTFIGK